MCPLRSKSDRILSRRGMTRCANNGSGILIQSPHRGEQRRWDSQAERFGRVEVDDELKLGRQFELEVRPA